MAKPDIVLNALHGGKGEDGSIQGLLECMDIPFVGSGVSASALCMDKTLCKTVMKNAGIPVIDSMCVCRGDDTLAAAESAGRLGYPLIVKPNRGGSSIGISVVENAESLKKAIDGIFAEYDDDAIVEKYINGNEVTCAVVLGENGPEVISLLDINKTRGIFDYKAKYEDKEWSGGISSLPSYMQDMINGIAKKAFVLLGCSGYACVDMIIDEEQIYVIEVNTLPGMTEQSLIPNAVKALGTDMGDFLDRLIGDVL
jgi:D-alanine-D-alanine ligase